MKIKFSTLAFVLLLACMSVFAQSSTWLDRSLTTNWNRNDGVIPSAPRSSNSISGACRSQIRSAESAVDRALNRAGWTLFGSSQTFGNVTVVNGMAAVDGMCRPLQFNTFVFVGTKFAGTLSPNVMNSREDSALTDANLNSPTEIAAEYTRYTDDDGLCCPSRMTRVEFSITGGTRPIVNAVDVFSYNLGDNTGGGIVETQDNVVSGTVTYRQRSALPPTAVITVRLVDISNQDSYAPIIAEQRIPAAGKQVPFPFDITFDRAKIADRNRYAIQAEIRDGGRLLFITDTDYSVLTQGNPRTIEVTVVPVGSSQGGFRNGVIRGTVTSLTRMAIPANTEITVKLFDSSDPNAVSLGETTFSTGNRQMPFPFELRFDAREISRQKSYELRAEARSGGTLRFKSEAGKQVSLRGVMQLDNVEIGLMPASDDSSGGAAITGKAMNLSKFGTGTVTIGNTNRFVVRGSVVVADDGNAEITVAGIEGAFNFSGRLTYHDDSTLRVAVTRSGDNDATGEIEVRYSGRNLRSITGSNLTIGGQSASIRF